MFKLPREAPLRGAGYREKPFGFYDATVDGGWEVPGEPYTNAPGTDFRWWRARMLGGRTNHWGRISLRMGEYDFKPKTRDGLGADWPLTYQDLAPYYDRTEMLIGVYGGDDDLENTPRSSPGVLQPAPPARRRAPRQEGVRAAGIPVIPAHLAIMTQRQDANTLPKRIHPGQPARPARARAVDARTAGLLLGHALRQRLLHQGELPVAPPCCCRPRSPPATSTSSPMPWCAR
jgi:choline dehydrogenase-like flavoprotein